MSTRLLWVGFERPPYPPPAKIALVPTEVAATPRRAWLVTLAAAPESRSKPGAAPATCCDRATTTGSPVREAS